MSAFLSACYGLLTYAFFLATFLYAIGFVGNVVVPKSIDTGATAPLIETLAVNLLLLGVFAIQHSVMARSAFKRRLTRLVPDSVERSTYVLASTAALALLFWQWRPMPEPVWTVTNGIGVTVLVGVFWLGWAMVLVSTFLISHFELFGLRQSFARLFALPASEQKFMTPFLYKRVRHPIYLGFLLAFWATPAMTAGHLLFAIMTMGYILVGIFFEERDMVARFGDRYRRYRNDVGMLLPRPRVGNTKG